MQPVNREPDVVVAPPSVLAERWAAHVTAAARAAVADRGRYSLAIPGGSVAARFLPAMVGADIAWEHVELLFCDERCVPPDNPDSNFGAADRLLLSALGERRPRVHRMRGEDPDPKIAARDYADTLRSVLGSPPVLDTALLGVGEDGHVASLFPGHPAISATDRDVIVETSAPKPPARRLTLSLGVLASARAVVVAAFGDAKAAALADALENPGSELPLARLLGRARRASVFLDEHAASRLRNTGSRS
jgi:6-phosphogluconolactonase